MNKKLKEVFNRNKIYPFPWYLAEQCLTKDIKNIFGIKIQETILECKNKDNTFGYFCMDEMEKIGKFFFDKIKKDKKFYKKVESKILNYSKDLLSFSEKIKKINYKKITNQELIKIFEDYVTKIKLLRTWGWIPTLIDGSSRLFLSDYIQAELKKKLENFKKNEEIARYYSILSSSEKKSEVQQEEIDRLLLIKKIQNLYPRLVNIFKKDFIFFKSSLKNKKNILKLIENHTKKFEWLPYAYAGPKMNIEDVFNLIKESLSKKENIKDQIKIINDRYKNLKKTKKQILKELNLSSELKYILEMSTFFMYLKDFRKGVYQKSYVAMDCLMIEIAKRINLDLDEIKFLSFEEIKQAILNKNDFSKIAKERLIHCVCVTKNGTTKIFQGEKAEEIINKKTSKNDIIEKTEIKGSIAYSGKITGIAKIVLTTKDIEKTNKGDILVSSSTNPDLILAMKKAAAFVTDMGGITSHAAIVSREMQKPCIVGTKIATKIIKDGDLIEVDANIGIVKIIKKYEKN